MLLINIKHFLINLRQEGGRETLRRICFRFLRINSFYIFSLDLSCFKPPVSVTGKIKVEEVMLKDLCTLREQYDELPSEFYIDKLDPNKKYRSFICFVNEFPALIVWVCAGQSSGFVELGTNDVEMNHIYCLKPFRGKKLLQNTIGIIASQMKEECFGKIVTVVHSDNIASIKSIERCGFGRIGVLKRLGLHVWKAQQ